MPDPISWEFSWPFLIGALAGGYLLGSIPFGLVLTRLAGLGDVRKIGSGNIGTTNVLRTGRKDLAALTLLLDAGKGAAAVVVAGIWGPDAALMAAFGAILGHFFPIWLRFRGGKGVATALGVYLGMMWLGGLITIGLWILVALVTRYSSLAALLSIGVSPLTAWLVTQDLQMVQFTAIVAVAIWLKHHENIRRLAKGEESKIGKRSS